jgi:hypothetical protein
LAMAIQSQAWQLLATVANTLASDFCMTGVASTILRVPNWCWF